MTAMDAQAQGSKGEGAQDTAVDRRDGATRRMPLEALVEVGAGRGGGFEADAVDVSVDGIRLRTAHMPAIGEKLVCRFDGLGGEVIAEGEVIWRRDEARGGEFGLRFERVDKKGAALLRALSAVGEGAADAKIDVEGALPGSRVRLHIQGLGSPMRARVREVASGEVLIGSNLEFLKVGRGVELEDVEQGATRQAHIEHVTVDIDKETAIPQLVVALRYDGEGERGEDQTTAPYRVAAVRAVAAPKDGAEREKTPEPTVIDAPRQRSLSARADQSSRSALDEPPATLQTPLEAVAAEGPEDGDGAAEDVSRPGFSPLRAGRKLADRIGPTLANATRGTKSALGKILDAVRRKRVEHAQARDERARSRAPRRTTAPPPSGALRSDGKRLFRERDREPSDAAIEAPIVPPRRDKKRLVFGVVLGILAVVSIYAFASTLGKRAPDDPAAVKMAAEGAVTANAAAGAPGAGGVPTAKVPLFGETPLSTTEPAPPPPPAAGGAELGEEGGTVDDGGDAASAALQKEWGVGNVTSPTVLKIKMDGEISGLTGTEGQNGFTLRIPGRQSTSSAVGLQKKDKRLDSVTVTNYPDRCEVTVTFKGDVPSFLAKAVGKRLDIELGSEKSKKAATGDKTKAKSSAKKKTKTEAAKKTKK
ncbi:MAG: PilZ domain-containing protein [Polyangiaceae bacterium]|nr:PilZ domain-containing protein [Polyangiaceae bacterium]